MMKGVNRYVLEIPRPDSAYFEKVIFFVKPEHSADSESKLRTSALALMEDSAPPKQRYTRGKRIIIKILHLFIAAGGGAALACVLSQLN